MFPYENISKQTGVFNWWIITVKDQYALYTFTIFLYQKITVFTWVDRLISDSNIISKSLKGGKKKEPCALFPHPKFSFYKSTVKVSDHVSYDVKKEINKKSQTGSVVVYFATPTYNM